MFYNPVRNIRAVVHGDDFTMLGKVPDLDWFYQQMRNKFEVKFKARLGPGEKDRNVRVLNRLVEWSNEGITYEPDQRHAHRE